MDITTHHEPIKATRIGLGVEGRRTLRGMMWFTGGLAGHSSAQCAMVDPTTARRLPVFEEDGDLFTDFGGAGKDYQRGETKISECTRCPEASSDESWREYGACFDTLDERLFSDDRTERLAVIEEKCNVCPVQLECLEYGERGGPLNEGVVWGGIYFVYNRTQRRKDIAAQRTRIERGEFG